MSATVQAIQYRPNYNPNPNKNRNRKLMMPWHIGLIKMSSNAFRLIMNIVSAYGDDGIIRFKRQTLADICQLSLRQLDRALFDLKKIDLISTRQTGRSLQFFLGDIFWKDAPTLKVISDDQPDPDPENQSYHQWQSRVHLDGNSLINSKRKPLKEKQQQPPDLQPPVPPKSQGEHKPGILSSSKQPAADPPSEKKSPAGLAAEVSKIRQAIPPEISFRINDHTIKTLIGTEMKHIEYAAKQAIDSMAKNKPGLFLNLCRQDTPEMARYKKRKQVAYPTGPDVTQKQLDVIFCYNRNCSGAGCRTMQGKVPAGENCKKYCPFILGKK